MHLSRRLKCTIVITRCPSSVRQSLTFHIFDFFSETAERNSMKLHRKQDPNVLYKVCVFRADQKNKMAALASDWLRHFQLLLWNRLNGIQRNLTGSKISTSSTKFVFFGADRKNKMAALASDWLRYFRLLLLNCLMEFKERKQDLNVLYQVCVFSGRSVNKNISLGRFLKKVAHCTQVHDMWPFGPLVFLF